jgi:hypothetical protein
MREALRTQDRGRAGRGRGRRRDPRGAALRLPAVRRRSERRADGCLAELEISFVVSDAVPGSYARLDLVTGPGPDGAPALRETITFEGTEKSG